MRSPAEIEVALQCLAMANAHGAGGMSAGEVVQAAAKFYGFVTGKEEDDAKRKLDAFREFITATA